MDQWARTLWLCAWLLAACDAYDERLLEAARISSKAREQERDPFLKLDAGANDSAANGGTGSDASTEIDSPDTKVDASGIDPTGPGVGVDPPDAGVTGSDASTSGGDAGGGIVVPEPEPEPEPDEDAGTPEPPGIPCADLGGTVSPDNGHCYFPVTMRQTWFVSRDRCNELGGELVTITSLQEQAFVSSLLGSASYWTGLARFGSRFTWHSGELFAFQNFESGEPDGVGEVGVLIRNGTGRWFDESLRDLHPSMCERP